MHKITILLLLSLPELLLADADPEKFFSQLAPIVNDVNMSVYKDRTMLIGWANKFPLKVNSKILALQKKYMVTDCVITESRCIAELKKRVDIVPTSLALAQSGLESGFGTSRFAKEGNALYGQWCFKKGCGIRPKNPDSAKGYYAVERFDTPMDATIEYVHNLNTQNAYSAFRDLRASQRTHGIRLNSNKLARTLTQYSTSGNKYIIDIETIIKTYRLDKYDHAIYSSLFQSRHQFV